MLPSFRVSLPHPLHFPSLSLISSFSITFFMSSNISLNTYYAWRRRGVRMNQGRWRSHHGGGRNLISTQTTKYQAEPPRSKGRESYGNSSLSLSHYSAFHKQEMHNVKGRAFPLFPKESQECPRSEVEEASWSQSLRGRREAGVQQGRLCPFISFIHKRLMEPLAVC